MLPPTTRFPQLSPGRTQMGTLDSPSSQRVLSVAVRGNKDIREQMIKDMVQASWKGSDEALVSQLRSPSLSQTCCRLMTADESSELRLKATSCLFVILKLSDRVCAYCVLTVPQVSTICQILAEK